MNCNHILYLASGSSRRFGKNKLLTQVRGKPLFLHGLEMLHSLAASRQDCRLLVVSRYEAIRGAAASLGIPAADSPDSERGVSYTIKAGLKALGAVPEGDFLLFVVADQPGLRRESVERLLELAKPGTETACLGHHGNPGNPTLFSASLIPELYRLEGDQGGRTVARRHACILVETDPGDLQDIDYLKDLKQV